MPTIEDISGCTGCTACKTVCPQQCITMVLNSEGFLHPEIDADRCTLCSMCYEVCPTRNPKPRVQNRQAYAVWSTDAATRFNSTSGGAFTQLALSVLERGGYVAGARYGEESHVHHDIISQPQRLSELRQSKYVQSDKLDVYARILALVRQGSTVMFVGTPCECAGLAQLMPESAENLILCDFICRGACSPLAYNSYLRFLEARHGSKIIRVWFKNKSLSWNQFSTRVDFENGEVYLQDRYHDLYMRGYLEANLFMRSCCGNCQFKGAARVSDITLADFWGVERLVPSVDTSTGVSLVIVNTPRGATLLGALAGEIECVPVDCGEALRGNPMYHESASRNPCSNDVMREISSGVPFDRAVEPKLRKSSRGSLLSRVYAVLSRRTRRSRSHDWEDDLRSFGGMEL